MITITDIMDIVVNTLPLENFVDINDLFRTTTCLHMYNISGQMIMEGGY